MQLAESTRRRLGWILAIALLVVAVVPISLFYGLDFRASSDHSCANLRSDMGETSDWWAALAFVFGPLVAGLLAYAWIVLFAPGRLERTRWRFALGLPLGVVVTVVLFFAAASGFFIYNQCPS
jgi:hypothetical protein